MKILVSGSSGIIGYGILKSLRYDSENNKDLILIGTSIYTDSIANAFCDIFIKAVPTNNQDYIKWLLQTITDNDIDIIIPGIDADMYKWSDNRKVIEETGTIILLNKLDLINLCKDKWDFYIQSKKNNLPGIIESSLNNDFNELVNNFGNILLAKPRHGFGSKGIVKIDNIEIFKSIKDKIGSELLIQPFIGNNNDEYTTSAFCDGKGNYFNIFTLKRKLSKDGFTEKAKTIDIPEINNIVSILCKHFKPIGPTNFQFRKHNDEFKLLEINPRISSSTSIRCAFGYNEALMSVDYFFYNTPVKNLKIKCGHAIRYIEDFIFYE